ncbi:ATP-binding protein [Streptomyces sp. PTM05]|uniref:ATP-binding protein n=1 Tax=Streptantibioticus parmotrematis TaxID=2873249 RepID=A0ABS7R178_9ACTN|nr:ATP-binding protein [Streptantibioticus parmotrematis]
MPDAAAVWVGRLRRIGRAKLNAWGLTALVDDAQLLISELVTNGLRHSTEQQITFRLVVGTDVLVMEVDDGSPALPRLRQADSDALDGRGLLLVDAVAASWGVSSDGTRTWCTLKFPDTARRSR